eukprot:TRINITY_DN93595_c0_g1_i1.p4 TRINITY_DN93595_c0_g1~~TRINITY_DN93595_c0_g1_i1.p4  ORF type:complete len:175 (-),score=0.62 TRINITY_DN93595_c0_g1_i1:156-680(-)
MVAHIRRQLHVMGHQQHGAPFCGQILDDPDHLLFQFGIQRAGRLIEQQSLGLHAQRARDGGPLLLPAGQLRGIDIAFVADTDLVEIRTRGRLSLGLVAAQNGTGRFHHILQDRHMRPKVELLKHHRQVGADAQHLFGIARMSVCALAFPDHRLALEQDVALLAVFQQVGTSQQR